MPLYFCRMWDLDPNAPGRVIHVAGAPFDVNRAKALLRQAVQHSAGAGLKTSIDQQYNRVIKGPHKTSTKPGELKKDSKLHMTVFCFDAQREYHIRLNEGTGNLLGSPTAVTDYSQTGSPGNQNDIPNLVVANSAAL